ncbi:MAG: DUF3105 domain-containing protein [Kofleriaceae bacterium]|nr:DUF3105 domain-containing protein [Kofleriaceae bacterium]
MDDPVEVTPTPAATPENEHRLHRVVILAMAGGAFLVIAAVAVLTATGGRDQPSAMNAADPKVAASRAGCKLARHRDEGASHTTKTVRYRSNPPTSGDHSPEPALDGLFDPGSEPRPEQLVHALEHGRVILQYRPGIEPGPRAALEALFEEPVKGSPAYHTILVQNGTEMSAAVAATSWTRSITCPRASPEAIAALRAFRERYVDQAPELVP